MRHYHHQDKHRGKAGSSMNVEIPTYPRLPETPIVGRRYLRPCVRASWPRTQPKWIPVVGTLHKDTEHLHADFLHIHVDHRFLCDRDRQRALREAEDYERFDGVNPVFMIPISKVVPAGTVQTITVEEAIRSNHPVEKWLSVRRRPYLGPYPEYPQVERTSWRLGLTAAYADHQLTDGHIGPHQGTDLTGIAPDDDGVVTCPLHGLRWCARTGRIVAATPLT